MRPMRTPGDFYTSDACANIPAQTKMTKRLSVFFFFTAAIYAGQSFVFSVTTQTLQNTSVPAQSVAWYKEFYFDAFPATLAANPWFANANEASTGLLLEL